MTRKDYIALAGALKRAADTAESVEASLMWGRTCHEIADVLADDNSNFARDKFMTACGWQQHIGTLADT
jgi:hypothetical protein